MPVRTLFLSLSLLMSAVMALEAAGNDRALVVKESRHDVMNTLTRLESLVKAKGMSVFAVIDHRANAHKVGMEMSEERVLLFGNPRAGTRLMSEDPRIGLDLPMRVLVYKDPRTSKVYIAYRRPSLMRKEYAIESIGLIEKLEAMLSHLSDQAAR